MLRALLLSCLVSTAAWAGPARISLDVHQADLLSVLRLFADLGHLNLVAGDEVHGKVTLRLRNVTWDQAFRVVLASHALGAEREDNVVRVAPLKQLAEEAEQRRKLQADRALARPLVTRLIPVNYASAAELAAQVKALLSPRGTVAVDARTNTLIVTDVE